MEIQTGYHYLMGLARGLRMLTTMQMPRPTEIRRLSYSETPMERPIGSPMDLSTETRWVTEKETQTVIRLEIYSRKGRGWEIETAILTD